MKTYHNFDLLITHTRDGYAARVIASPAGESSAVVFRLPFAAPDLKDFFWLSGRALRQAAGTSVTAPTAPLDVQTFGSRLFTAVFAEGIDTLFRRSVDRAREDEDGLRIRLRLNDVPELADLPWEFLYADELSIFPALSRWTPIVRYVEQDRPSPSLAVSAPLTLLAVLANPAQDFEPLNIEAEWTHLQTALADLGAQDRLVLERLATPSLPALQDRLRKSPVHMIHFIGHGFFDDESNEGGLLFEDAAGAPVLVNSAQLAALVGDTPSVRLVFLNACEGARGGRTDPFGGVAQKLVQQGVPAVVAMQFDVSDRAAVTLAQEFYEAIADGLPVDAALAEARKAVYTAGNPREWGTPVLFSRSPDNALFTPAAQAAAVALQPTITNISTDGGAAFEGAVSAGRDVAGRDIVTINHYYQTQTEVAEDEPLADFDRLDFEPPTVLVDAGVFWMGRERGERVASHETPRHAVTLDAFRIGICPVTNGQFARFIEAERRIAPPELGWPGQKPSQAQANLPVAGVTWYEALDYCAWLRKCSGRRYTLPSEAEWERAARGVDGRLFPWGNEWDPELCNTDPERISACGDYPGGVSPAGCFDMVGNLREWTATVWGEKRTQPDASSLYPWQDDERNAITTANDMIRRVYRGGTRSRRDTPLTVTLRGGELPTQRGLSGMRMGFRVVIKRGEAP